MQPKVTIGIPTYNREKYLKEALESVLTQDYPNIEIIVSDNHSTDGTEEYIKTVLEENADKNIHYNRMSQNLGHGPNWNYCWNHATGEYCLILSDDDALLPGAVSSMVNAFDEDVVSVVGQCIQVDPEGVEHGRFINKTGVFTDKEFWKMRLCEGAHDTPSALMYRLKNAKEAMAKGTFNVGSAGDLAMNLLMIRGHKIALIENFTTLYRVHPGNDSDNVLRCSQGHANLYNFFENQGYEKDDLQVLRTYCIQTIWAYTWMGLIRQHSFIKAKECLKLLSNNFNESRIIVWIKFFTRLIKMAIKKVLKTIFSFLKKNRTREK